MKPTAYFGFMCPQCNSTVDIGAGFEATPTCSQCNVALVPNPNAKPATANAYCANCKSFAGIVNSDRCPACGGPFSASP